QLEQKANGKKATDADKKAAADAKAQLAQLKCEAQPEQGAAQCKPGPATEITKAEKQLKQLEQKANGKKATDADKKAAADAKAQLAQLKCEAQSEQAAAQCKPGPATEITKAEKHLKQLEQKANGKKATDADKKAAAD